MLFNFELFHPVKDHWLGVASFPLCFLGGTMDVPHFPRPHWSFDVHLCGERCPLLTDDVEIYFVGSEYTVLMLFSSFCDLHICRFYVEILKPDSQDKKILAQDKWYLQAFSLGEDKQLG